MNDILWVVENCRTVVAVQCCCVQFTDSNDWQTQASASDNLPVSERPRNFGQSKGRKPKSMPGMKIILACVAT